MAADVAHAHLSNGHQATPAGTTTTTEEIITLPDGRKRRLIRTLHVVVEQTPVEEVRSVKRAVTNTATTRQTVVKAQPSRITGSTGNGDTKQHRKPKREDQTRHQQLKGKPQQKEERRAPQISHRQAQSEEPQPIVNVLQHVEEPKVEAKSVLQLDRELAGDIPYADEDVSFDLVPSSQNTASLIRAASISKKKAYSTTDTVDNYTTSEKSPQPKLEKPSLHGQNSILREGPKIQRKLRPHSYHAGSDGDYRNSNGNYGNVSSANSSFLDETDGDPYSFQYQSQQLTAHRTPDFLNAVSSRRSNYNYRQSSAMTEREPCRPGTGERRYKQHIRNGASLNRAASLQLRAYKTKTLSAMRTTSLDDDWLPSPQCISMRKKTNRQSVKRRSWTTGQFTLKECRNCAEKHVSVDGLLSFDEFHDQFIHTQWPAQTIMLCELKFYPSNKVIKIKITSCNRLSRDNSEDGAKHAEIFFSEFLYEKVVPNLLGGALEKLDISIWMNNSPCNQRANKCSETLLDVFRIIETLVADCTLNLSFCHMAGLMNHPEPTRSSDLSGLVKLMSHRNVTIRPFNGYDWMELLMLRTARADKWLTLANTDRRALIEQRCEKDQKTRACLRQMVLDYREEISDDITHLRKAMARINHI